MWVQLSSFFPSFLSNLSVTFLSMMMSSDIYNSYSKHLNKFVDYAEEFKEFYVGHKELEQVSSVIVSTIMYGLDLPFDHIQHPFAMYASIHKSKYENISSLAHEVMNKIQQDDLRPYVVSFFHSSGANHDELVDLTHRFFRFADSYEFDPPQDDDTCSDSEYSDSEYSLDSLVEELNNPNIVSQNNSE